MTALTLQEARSQTAKKYGYENWGQVQQVNHFDKLNDEAALSHSLSCQEALTNTAIETIELWRINNEDDIQRNPVAAIDQLKEAIRLTPLIEG